MEFEDADNRFLVSTFHTGLQSAIDQLLDGDPESAGKLAPLEGTSLVMASPKFDAKFRVRVDKGRYWVTPHEHQLSEDDTFVQGQLYDLLLMFNRNFLLMDKDMETLTVTGDEDLVKRWVQCLMGLRSDDLPDIIKKEKNPAVKDKLIQALDSSIKALTKFGTEKLGLRVREKPPMSIPTLRIRLQNLRKQRAILAARVLYLRDIMANQVFRRRKKTQSNRSGWDG